MGPLLSRCVGVADEIQIVARAWYFGLMRRAATKPAAPPKIVRPRISHLYRKSARIWRMAEAPPSSSSVTGGGGPHAAAEPDGGRAVGAELLIGAGTRSGVMSSRASVGRRVSG